MDVARVSQRFDQFDLSVTCLGAVGRRLLG